MTKTLPALILLVAVSASPVVNAEVLEEIVAWVNGDIITKSELEEEEQAVRQDAYQRYTGEELEKALENIRAQLLLRMIDRKILVDEARRLYDLEQMSSAFLKGFKEQQGISSDEELMRLLEQEGMDLAYLKRRLTEMFAPEEVIRYRVTSRVAVSDKEVEDYYEKNRDQFRRKASVSLREIVLLADTRAERKEKRTAIEAIRQRALDGEDFEALARETSEAGTAARGGLIETTRNDLADHLAGPAFSVPVGQVSPVIEADYGYHLIRVLERDEAEVEPIEVVRERIRNLLMNEKSGRKVDEFLAKLREESRWCVSEDYRAGLPPAAGADCGEM